MFTQKIKLASRLLLASMAIVISFQAVGLLFFCTAPKAANADFTMNLQVPIPGGPSQIHFTNTTKPIADYIKTVYSFAIGIVGVVAAVVLMIAGLMWITAGGNSSNISEAKSMITAALTGMVLALTSYLILSQVNPALVNLQASIINPVKPSETQTDQMTCSWKEVTKTVSDANNFSYNCPSGSSETSTACDDANKPAVTNPDNRMNCCCVTSQSAATVAGAVNINGKVPCQNSSKCQVSEKLATALESFYNDDTLANIPWTVTGACPPSAGAHISSCHDTCTCVDIGVTGNNNADVLDIAKELKQTGDFGSFQYECTNSIDCCSGAYSSLRENGFNCSDKVTVCPTATSMSDECEKFKASGNHFHINQKK